MLPVCVQVSSSFLICCFWWRAAFLCSSWRLHLDSTPVSAGSVLGGPSAHYLEVHVLHFLISSFSIWWCIFQSCLVLFALKGWVSMPTRAFDSSSSLLHMFLVVALWLLFHAVWIVTSLFAVTSYKGEKYGMNRTLHFSAATNNCCKSRNQGLGLGLVVLLALIGSLPGHDWNTWLHF